MDDADDLLSSLTHAQASVPVVHLDYDYAAVGKLTTIIDELTPSTSRRLSYDSLDRLVQVDRGSDVADASGSGALLPVEDYAYDEEGNRFASHLSSLYVSNAHNQLTEDDTYTYVYDDRGNRVSRTAKVDGAVESYGYDSQNRLTSYSDGVTTASYAYDALDRRIAKTVDGAVEAYVLDAWSLDPTASEVVLDFQDGTLARRWLHGPRVDEPLEVESYAGTTVPGSGSLRSLLANRLGSIAVAVSVATGAVASEVEYDSFGQREIVQGAETDLVRYGYTGREHDAESGLIYYRARHYDPALGQFLQQDPIGFAAGDLNLYAYVENDPFNATDPSGLTSSASYGANSNQSANTARVAAANVGRGVLGLAGRISTALRSTTSTRALLAADRAVSCGSAAASAIAGDYAGAATDGFDCATGGRRGQFRDANGSLRNSNGTFAYDGGRKLRRSDGTHRNSLDSPVPTTLYARYDGNGVFQKWGISSNPARRYTRRELGEGRLDPIRTGSRRDIRATERWLEESNPGPLNIAGRSRRN